MRLCVSTKRQVIRIVTSFSVMKREEPRFVRSITASARNVSGQELKSNRHMTFAERQHRRRTERIFRLKIRWYLGHNDIATTRGYIMNNQGKQKTTKAIINALSEMNGSDVLKGTQNHRNKKSPEAS